VWSNQVVSTANLSFVGSLASTGRDVQLSNGAGKSSMYATSFYPFTAPYSFSTPTSLGSVSGLAKSAPASIANSRGGYVGNKQAQIYYSIGGLSVDGLNVPFVAIPDTFTSTSVAGLNSVLVSQPFVLGSNTKLHFNEETAAGDSLAAIRMLGESGYVLFNVELLDAATNSVLGTIKQTKFSSATLNGYTLSAYSLDAEEFSGRTVKVRVTVSTNIDEPLAQPVDGYAAENTAADAEAQSLTLRQSAVKEFSLSQNYPNPFNPTTTISYALPKASHVTLKVYDMLGREVATLVNDFREQGRYTATFDATHLASGVYISRLVAGDYTKTMKMLMIK
jgi:hypothetical protein